MAVLFVFEVIFHWFPSFCISFWSFSTHLVTVYFYFSCFMCLCGHFAAICSCVENLCICFWAEWDIFLRYTIFAAPHNALQFRPEGKWRRRRKWRPQSLCTAVVCYPFNSEPSGGVSPSGQMDDRNMAVHRCRPLSWARNRTRNFMSEGARAAWSKRGCGDSHRRGETVGSSS